MPVARLEDCPREAFIGKQFAHIGGKGKNRHRIQGEVADWSIKGHMLTVSLKWMKKAVDRTLNALEDQEPEELSFSLSDYIPSTLVPEKNYACFISLSNDYIFFIGPNNPSYIEIAA